MCYRNLMLHINVSRFLTSPQSVLFGGTPWQIVGPQGGNFRPTSSSGKLPAGMGMICPNDLEVKFTEVVEWWRCFSTPRESTPIYPERYMVATRWDLQDRDAVSDDEKRWVTGAYGNMGGDGLLMGFYQPGLKCPVFGSQCEINWNCWYDV